MVAMKTPAEHDRGRSPSEPEILPPERHRRGVGDDASGIRVFVGASRGSRAYIVRPGLFAVAVTMLAVVLGFGLLVFGAFLAAAMIVIAAAGAVLIGLARLFLPRPGSRR
jgi:predicted exporter